MPRLRRSSDRRSANASSTRQQRTVRSTSLEVARRCREAQLRAPNANTVRVRIVAIPPRERLSRRSHRKAAVDQFAPQAGVFDSAQRPLDLMQIDHTKLDIIVVDDEQRLPIGRLPGDNYPGRPAHWITGNVTHEFPLPHE
jgi:hypothetical protein